MGMKIAAFLLVSVAVCFSSGLRYPSGDEEDKTSQPLLMLLGKKKFLK
jgi:hypothetical protein